MSDHHIEIKTPFGTIRAGGWGGLVTTVIVLLILIVLPWALR